ncbi:MAG: AAA family ATPase [Lachnospiraceae bacterium]|nr:AAA family ATPase [Lachnospiraceae bacterium]
MMNIDKQIANIDQVICSNIDLLEISGITRAFVSQNLLAQSRNIVEHIAVKAYGNGADIMADWKTIPVALEYIKHDYKFLFLRRFHGFLQESKSHYTPDADGAERLALKYYEYYMMLRAFAKKEYGLEILHNIDKFPINIDMTVSGYYRAVLKCIEKHYEYMDYSRNERLYVMRSKPVIVDGRIFYENTLIPANDVSSKFDRFMAFSAFMIPDHYAIRADIRDTQIDVKNQKMPVNILLGYQVSLRPCELKNFAKIFGYKITMNQGLAEYKGLMKYLTMTGGSLTDIILSSEEKYKEIKSMILENARTVKFYDVLDEARNVVLNNKRGRNIILYLSYVMRNKVIKDQFSNEENYKLSMLRLQNGTIPFEEMPFCTSLIDHNSEAHDIFGCIPNDNIEAQLLARYIQTNTSNRGHLYTKREEVEHLGDIDKLIATHNGRLYYKHRFREICKFGKNYLYIKEHYENTKLIIEKLIELSKDGIAGYRNFANYWMTENPETVNCDEKKVILQGMFETSKVFLIYGAAGTGKTYLLNHVAQLFDDRQKLFLANTNPAVDNLRRKIRAQNCEFSTIAKFTGKRAKRGICDMLIMDECSMISNSNMREALENINHKLLVLVGDTYQIEAISFGNWFSLARYFLPSRTWNELVTPFRAKNKELLELWGKVRNLDDDVTEHLVQYKYSSVLDESIFQRNTEDEIILCLNYNGLYGINNINRFLQSNNPSLGVRWGLWTYKIGDPILFNENKRFAPVLFNNLKGWIVDIEVEADGERIWFSIEIDKAINELDVSGLNLKLLNPESLGRSVVKFYVNKFHDSDDDYDTEVDAVVPFQIAYAVSIHKAQGLEYESVKVVITEDIDEMITHNIFYTAITRARSNLKIYWSPESQQRVISRFEKMDAKNDATIFSAQSGLKIVNKCVKKDEPKKAKGR